MHQILTRASVEEQEHVLAKFKEGVENNTLQKVLSEDEVARVIEKDIFFNLGKASVAILKNMFNFGLKRISKLSYVTSGAGLWSRGGGVAKALVPFNLQELVSKQIFDRVVLSGEMVKASKMVDVCKLAGLDTRLMSENDIEERAARYLKEAKAFF